MHSIGLFTNQRYGIIFNRYNYNIRKKPNIHKIEEMQNEHRLSLLKQQGIMQVVNRDDAEGLKYLLEEFTYDHGDLAQALRAATQRGNEDCTHLLILECKKRNPVLLDMHDSNGYSPLIIACRQGYHMIVQLLIDYKCNINKATLRIRATGLHWAATYGHEDCVMHLIKAGCNIEAKTIQGRTALMLASRSGFGDCVDRLLLSGASVFSKDLNHNTALHYACEEGNVECAKLLLNAGSDVNKTSSSHMTPLLLAAKKGHAKVLSLLLGQPKTQLHVKTPSQQLTALHWSAESGDTDCLQLLIAHGLDPDTETESGCYEHDLMVNKGLTPLMVTCQHGHREAAHYLLNIGCDVNHYDCEGFTPLTHAIYRGHADVVLDLIRSGADIDLLSPTTDHIQCPLFIAIRRSPECLKLLLRANVNLNMVGPDSRGILLSPLELALSASNRSISCRMLLAAGYRPTFIANPNYLQECMAKLIMTDMDEELFLMISERVENCGSLLHLCRDTLRKSLDRRVLSGDLDRLPLPQRMKDFIYVKELDELY